MTDYSCIAVHGSLKAVSKDIKPISGLRDGKLLILAKAPSAVEKFLNLKELSGICKVSCKLHESLNFVKGTIYAPCLNNVSEDEILEELEYYNVVQVFKFNRFVDGSQKPSGVLLLTFDAFNLPPKVDIAWYTCKVKKYYPNPMRCKNCQKLGHTAKRCNNSSTCVGCNLPPHHPNQCTRTLCTNCLQNHPASSKDCPRFIEQKEILKIKIDDKCSMFQARKKYNNNNKSSQVNSCNYATVTSNREVSTSVTPQSRIEATSPPKKNNKKKLFDKC